MISVIIPVYNAEKYLRQCVESVLAQTSQDWEMILVDDGSTDSSGEICDSYAASNSRVRVIHQQNAGPSMARNRGISESQGDRLVFIDSDDWVSPRYLEVLSRIMDETDADISSVSFNSFREKPEVHSSDPEAKSPVVLSGEKALEKILYQTGSINNSVWGKLFRREIWGDTKFPSGLLYEDLEVTYHLYPQCSRIAHIDCPLYHYRSNPESLLHTVSPRRRDIIGIGEEMILKFNDNPLLYMAACDRLLSASFNMLGLMAAHPEFGDGEFREHCRRIVERYSRASLRNGKVRLKNKIGIMIYKLGGRRVFDRIAARVYR